MVEQSTQVKEGAVPIPSNPKTIMVDQSTQIENDDLPDLPDAPDGPDLDNPSKRGDEKKDLVKTQPGPRRPSDKHKEKMDHHPYARLSPGNDPWPTKPLKSDDEPSDDKKGKNIDHQPYTRLSPGNDPWPSKPLKSDDKVDINPLKETDPQPPRKDDIPLEDSESEGEDDVKEQPIPLIGEEDQNEILVKGNGKPILVLRVDEKIDVHQAVEKSLGMQEDRLETVETAMLELDRFTEDQSVAPVI